MKKRLFILLTCLICGISWMSAFEYNGFKFSVISKEEKTCRVNGFAYEKLAEVIIPEKAVNEDGVAYSVTEVGSFSEVWGEKIIKTVKLPESVIIIGNSVFWGCKQLTSCNLPKGLINIGQNAFSGCESLSNLDFPNTLTTIEDNAFSECSSLTSLKLPDSLTQIGKSAFSRCSGLESVKLPNTLTEINESVFLDCTGLKYIDLPDDITSIGDYAFEGCRSLTSIDFPEGLTNVGKGAFWGCVNAESVAINGNPKIDVYYPFFWDSLTTVIYNTNKIIEYSTTLFDKAVYNNATLYVPQEFINKIKTTNIKPWHDFNNLQALPSINLNHQNIDTWTGAIKELYVDISPEEIPFGEVQIEWYSTDSSIVKINGEGNKATLEALKEGQTTVNCILSWGKIWKQTLQCHINIKKSLERIKIESETDSLIRGESLILSTVIEPSDADYQEITWTTSDDSVAEVKPTINGQAVVTGLKGGKVTITAEAGSKEEGCYASATLDLVVIQPVESLFIDPTSKEAEEGETFQITATVLPEDATDKTLEWSSSDETIATVDQTGLVSVLKEGECVITAKTTDGSDLSANCYLSVTTRIILAKSLSLNPISKETEEGDTFQIIATVLPEDATDKTLEWSSSDETVATVDETGLVSVLKEGECVITAKTTDGSDLTANCYLSATSGINNVSFDTDETVDVYSLDGVKVRTNCKKNEALNLPAGAYLLRKGNKVEKLIIR